ncbi:MAG: ribosome small subunit-dependent GTPase A [Treponema sp.]|nr:MAG: ribosome small subunit-dependent GTPase A [Treponema sp.]
MEGIILTGSNNFFNVACNDTVTRRCNLKGKILKPATGFHNPLAPGDKVIIEPDIHDNNEGQIIDLIPRKNSFGRFNEKSRLKQILAANIDLLLCFTTPNAPPFRPRFLDRVLIQAESDNIPTLIVVNKIDLGIPKNVQDRIDNWKSLNYKVMLLSAKTKEGVKNLVERISGLTITVTGQSGVGKSSLLNAIDPTLNLKTAELSRKENRGNHTTIQGAYYNITSDICPNKTHKINLIDTPGVRDFGIAGIDADDVALYFPEMESVIGKCKFGLSCTHKSEPGCKVLELLHSGKIHKDRYESWLNIRAELIARTKGIYD